MNILKFLEKFFGSLLIILALTIIFSGLSIHYSIDNINVLTESINVKLPQILQENKELFAERIFEELDVDKTKLQMACLQKPEELSEDFCNKLESLETEEDIKEELINVMILKMQEQMQPEFTELEQNIRSKIGKVKFYSYCMIPAGLLILLIGSFLIFLAEKFKCIPTTFNVSLKISIFSGFITISNYFLKNLTPEKLEEITKTLPIMKSGESPELALKLMSSLLADWVSLVAGKLFIISLITAIVFLSIAVIMFTLKRKKS